MNTKNTNANNTNNKRQHDDDENNSYEIVLPLKPSRTEHHTANPKHLKWSQKLPLPNINLTKLLSKSK